MTVGFPHLHQRRAVAPWWHASHRAGISPTHSGARRPTFDVLSSSPAGTFPSRHPVTRFHRLTSLLLVVLFGLAQLDGSGVLCNAGMHGAMDGAMDGHAAATSARSHDGGPAASVPANGGSSHHESCPMSTDAASCRTMSACGPVLLLPALAPVRCASPHAIVRSESVSTPRSIARGPESPPPRD